MGADFSAKNFGKVTPVTPVVVESISIVGESNVFGTSAQYEIQYNPSNTSQKGVIWSIVEGNTYATINSSGVLTILPTAKTVTITIKAVSTYNSSILATKSVTITYDDLQIMEQYITLDFSNTKQRPELILKDSSKGNYLEKMLYSTDGTVKLNTFDEQTSGRGALQYITDDMYMIDIPSGATKVRLYGDDLYFNTRNIRVTTLQSSLAPSTRVETTLDSVPYDVTLNSGATYLYIRISVASQGSTYVKPKISWIYE